MDKRMVLIIALCIGLSGFAPLHGQARIVELSGTVELQAAGAQEWQAASVGDTIGNNTVISTGLRSSALISLGSASLNVGPLTVLTLEELVQGAGSEEANLFLRTGRVRADVTPPAGVQADFTVRSPTTTASVRGTSFSFNGRRLAVHSGGVRLSSNINGQQVVVSSNQHSYISGRQGRLAMPFEAERAGLRPSLTGLADTGPRVPAGSGGHAGSGEPAGEPGTGVDVIIDWD